MAHLRRIDRSKATFQAIRPNEGTAADYRKRIDVLIKAMHRSVTYWLKASYRANEPVITQDQPPASTIIALDELPASALKKAIRRMSARWRKRFDEAAPDLAAYFAQSVNDRSDRDLKRILRNGGYSVRFQMTRAQRDVLKATVEQNVNLIKSIPRQYLDRVEGVVMRSVQTGRDLSTVFKEIESGYGISRRRAALISRDQNNKATASLARARQLELGITEAIWVHSGGGKEPRPTHLKAGRERQRFDLKKGWYDPHEDRYILPGELINCRCVARPVVPGFS